MAADLKYTEAVEGALFDAVHAVLATETDDISKLRWRVLVCLSGLVAKIILEEFGAHDRRRVKLAVKEHDRLVASALRCFRGQIEPGGIPPIMKH